MVEICVDENIKGQRLDRYAKKFLSKASPSFIYKMIRKKNIVVNDKKAKENQILLEGDIIKFYLADETIRKFQDHTNQNYKKIDLDIVYEDDNIIVLNKEKGLLSHDDGKDDHNLVDGVKAYYNEKFETAGDMSFFEPALANRLDKNTQGLVIGGLNNPALRSLNKGFRQGHIKRSYRAIVEGRILEPGWVDFSLTKSEENTVQIDESGKKTLTRYWPLAISKSFSLVDLDLVTGRTHQLRKHMSSIGHPILGDTKYGNQDTNSYIRKKYGIKYQVLQSYKVEFSNMDEPLDYLAGRVFELGLGDEFKKIMKGDGPWENI